MFCLSRMRVGLLWPDAPDRYARFSKSTRPVSLSDHADLHAGRFTGLCAYARILEHQTLTGLDPRRRATSRKVSGWGLCSSTSSAVTTTGKYRSSPVLRSTASALTRGRTSPYAHGDPAVIAFHQIQHGREGVALCRLAT